MIIRCSFPARALGRVAERLAQFKRDIMEHFPINWLAILVAVIIK
jgi:hypothetical protein